MFAARTRQGALIIIIAFMLISGSIIGLSQGKQGRRIDISSESGLKEQPRNLRVTQKNQNQQAKKEQEETPQGIPADVAYRQVFKHIAKLNSKADKKERGGEHGSSLRNLYKKMARLDERQARNLDRIANKTDRDLKALDNRARLVIEQIRLRTPTRRIAQGEKVPLPPQELFDLARQRRDITSNAIQELRENLGTAGFVSLTKFINEKVKPGIRKWGNGTTIQIERSKNERGDRQ